MKSGAIQALPYRDTAGRRIIAVLGNFGTSSHTLKNKVRVFDHSFQRLSDSKLPHFLCDPLSDNKDESIDILRTSSVRRRRNAKAGLCLLVLAVGT